tara:strand:- start:2624 stop:2854 length:231 start_codon:yes stop_codon:yes gene_type:complete
MSLTPIIVFHDRHNIQDKDWAYVSDCTVLWVDEEDLITDDDELKMTEDFNKSMILSKKPLMELVVEKPKNQGNFFV